MFLLLCGLFVQFFGDSHMGRIQIQTVGIPFTGEHDYIALRYLAAPATAFYIFVVSKTMDTTDGVDGLAAGIAAIAASTLTLIAVYAGQPRVAIIAAALAGASVGFLRHNPTKIFMGTGGAQLLGFCSRLSQHRWGVQDRRNRCVIGPRCLFSDFRSLTPSL